jgi:hypothetical protein
LSAIDYFDIFPYIADSNRSGGEGGTPKSIAFPK